MIALEGTYSLLIFLKGNKRELSYMECISPSIPPLETFETIDPTRYSPNKIPAMKLPKWDSLDWKIYNERRDPTISSVSIGEKLGISYKIVLRRYKKLLKDCKIWLPFFPNGYSNYTPYIISFRTKFETGFISELRKIDRSSYIYKFNDTMMLTLFFDQYLEIENLLKMEKNGIIHEVRVSSPVWHFDRFW